MLNCSTALDSFVNNLFTQLIIHPFQKKQTQLQEEDWVEEQLIKHNIVDPDDEIYITKNEPESTQNSVTYKSYE